MREARGLGAEPLDAGGPASDVGCLAEFQEVRHNLLAQDAEAPSEPLEEDTELADDRLRLIRLEDRAEREEAQIQDLQRLRRRLDIQAQLLDAIEDVAG